MGDRYVTASYASHMMFSIACTVGNTKCCKYVCFDAMYVSVFFTETLNCSMMWPNRCVAGSISLCVCMENMENG